MQLARSLPARFDWRPWGLALAAAVAVIWNLHGLMFIGSWWLNGAAASDWNNLANLSASEPYANEVFRWSPPAAWVWTALIQPIGLDAWRILHVASLVLLPWRIGLLSLAFAPFWTDTVNGNLLTFAFISAWYAVHGKPAGIVSFTVFAALVPRPLMLPVLAWLLWKHPLARWAFAAAAVVVLVWSLATGLADDFALRLLHSGQNELAMPWNIGPSRLLGAVWIPLGLVIAAVLTWKGRLGLASLAASPYVFHYYVIFLLMELRSRPAELDLHEAGHVERPAAALVHTEAEVITYRQHESDPAG